jgi:hypothetical protein
VQAEIGNSQNVLRALTLWLEIYYSLCLSAKEIALNEIIILESTVQEFIAISYLACIEGSEFTATGSRVFKKDSIHHSTKHLHKSELMQNSWYSSYANWRRWILLTSEWASGVSPKHGQWKCLKGGYFAFLNLLITCRFPAYSCVCFFHTILNLEQENYLQNSIL